MKNIRFGIIGAGNIAKKFVQAVQMTEGAELCAVASKSADRAKDFAKQWNISQAYDSYEALLQSNIDAVYIATTNNDHYKNILLAASYKKHILCEKPLCLNPTDAVYAFDAAKANNVFLMEAVWSRFLPSTQKVLSLIQEGSIGKIKFMNSAFSFFVAEKGDHRLFAKELGGGALYDLGIYNIALSLYFAGEYPEEFAGCAILADTGVDSSVSAVLKFPSGVLAHFICGFTLSIPNDMVIQGTKGTILLHSSFQDCHKVELIPNDSERQIFDFNYANGFQFEIREMIDCIRCGKLTSDIMPPQDTLQIAKLTKQFLSRHIL